MHLRSIVHLAWLSVGCAFVVKSPAPSFARLASAPRCSKRFLSGLKAAAFNPEKVRAISFDVTGTILVHRYPIMDTYADAAVWARLPNPPTAKELRPAFKQAYFKHLTESPCFGHSEGLSSSALEFCGRQYSEDEFNRFFRRVYQHYGSLDGYETLPDAVPFLEWASARFTLGVTTNTPARTVETVLPMTGLHGHFRWFVCSHDVGAEKPDAAIFDAVHRQAQFWVPGIRRDEILHVGDSAAADYCGARAAGFQALLLDRSDNPMVRVYQDWLKAPDYPGKTEDDVRRGTVRDLTAVRELLLRAAPLSAADDEDDS